MKVPVDECPAGRTMDAAVAKTLGLKVSYAELPDGTEEPVYLAGTYSAENDGWIEREDWRRVLPYSTDIIVAWELWSQLCTEWGYGRLSFVKDLLVKACLYKDSDALFNSNPAVTALSGKGCLTICRAFLKAKGVTEIEVEEESDGQG